MTYFDEENRVEQLVLDTLTNKDDQWCVSEPQADYFHSHLTLHIPNLKWRFVSFSEPGECLIVISLSCVIRIPVIVWL